MPIIDCHLHIHHRDRTVDQTIRHMEATGTDRAFILPLETGEGGVKLSTETVLEAYAGHRDRVIPFCQCDVRKDNVLERIRKFHQLGCRGVGEQKEHVRLNDKRLERVIALCNELNWPMTIHFQDNFNGYNQGIAEHLETYLKRYPRVRIIGHAQSWWSHISADVPDPEKTLYPTGPVQRGGLIDRLLAEYPNLYGDLSAGSGFNAITRDPMFGAEFLLRHSKKLLYGSDCPCLDGKGGNFKGGLCFATRLQAHLRRVIHDEEVLADIFHRNAERVLVGEV